MSLIRLFLSLASPRSNTNTRDPEIGLEILPEDTFDEPPSDDRHDIGNDDEDLNGEVDGIGDDANVNPSKPRLFHRFSSGTALTWSFSRTSTQLDKPWFQKVKDFVFPAREHIDSFIPNYRHLPIISGLLIPFSMCALFLIDIFHYLIVVFRADCLEFQASQSDGISAPRITKLLSREQILLSSTLDLE